MTHASCSRHCTPTIWRTCPSSTLPDFGDFGLLSQRAPRSSSRKGRVALLAECAEALLGGKAPSPEAAAFVGSAIVGWLQAGGSLEGHLRVGAPRGSHHRPQVLYRLIGDERQPASESVTLDSRNPITKDE